MASTTSLQRMDEHKRRAARLREADLVHNMRLAGHSYTKIAHALKITPQKASGLHREHIAYLQELEALGAMEADRRVQNERYETLLSGLWERAVKGDIEAVRECRMILDSITNREVKVTAMITKTNDDGTKHTLVAEGSSGEYIKALEGMR